MILRIQVIENAVFAFKQPPTLIRHIAVTCVVVALTVLASLLTDCVGIVLELNVRHAASSLLTSSSQLASCLIYARALLEYVIFILWVRSVSKMLPSVKFAEDNVLTFLIREKC